MSPQHTAYMLYMYHMCTACILHINYICTAHTVHIYHMCIPHMLYTHVWRVHSTCVSHTNHIYVALLCVLHGSAHVLYICYMCVVCAPCIPHVCCMHTTMQHCFTQNTDNLVDIILRRIQTHSIVVFSMFKNSKTPATKPTREALTLQQR